MASTDVFVRVVCAFKRPISGISIAPTMILTTQNIEKATAMKNGPRKRFLRGEATHKTNRTPTKNSGSFDKIEYQDD
jgi:hypothetical protein